VLENSLLLEEFNKTLKSKGIITVIGFDVLQVPRYKIVYKYERELD